MAKDKDKTNVMRVLDSKKIAYNSYSYTPDSTLTGEEIAKLLEKKHFNPDMERSDKDKIAAFIMRRGFSAEDIFKVMRSY